MIDFINKLTSSLKLHPFLNKLSPLSTNKILSSPDNPSLNVKEFIQLYDITFITLETYHKFIKQNLFFGTNLMKPNILILHYKIINKMHHQSSSIPSIITIIILKQFRMQNLCQEKYFNPKATQI